MENHKHKWIYAYRRYNKNAYIYKNNNKKENRTYTYFKY